MVIKLRNKTGLLIGIGLFLVILIIPTNTPIDQSARYTLACAVLMAVWWITEAVSLPVTALLPLILFPLFRIMNASEVALAYANSNIFLFMGGFFIAIAMQRHNLHRRIALKIISIFSTSPRRLILGFMVATAFLSMWISNTATAMMMLPIGIAVVEHFRNVEEYPEQSKNKMGIALMLGIAYSASIGGVGTLVGTPPNIIFAGIVKTLFPHLPEIDFITWMKIGIPIVLIFLPLVWFILVKYLMPSDVSKLNVGSKVIKDELNALGKMKSGEILTLVVFILTALGWIFRKDLVLGNFVLPGWASIVGVEEYVNDSTVALIGALLLFIIPSNFWKGEFVLNWEWAKRIPWGILVLFGGGFALADGFQSSGLDTWIGQGFISMKGFSPLILVICVCFLLTFLTEITSNTASISMILPILATMSIALGIHPFILMIPATFSASFAFMMPVATPPNAIVFGSGYLNIKDMVKIGIVLNLVGILLITILMYLVAFPILGVIIE